MFKQFVKDTPFGLSILLLALAVGLIALIAPIGGNKALIVRSGSMQPAIAVGDLVTVRPQTDYKTGEIVAFKDPAKSSAIVTHRIVGTEVKNDQVIYQTKGDANEEADFNLVPKENVIGRTDYTIRGVGKILAITKTRDGFLALAIGPAMLVIFLEIISIVKEVKKGKKTQRYQNTFGVGFDSSKVKEFFRLYEHYGKPMGLPHPSASFQSLISMLSLRGSGESRRRSNLSFRSVLPILISFLLIGSTNAFFTDTETSTGNHFQAANSFGPPIAQTLVINEIVFKTNCPAAQNKQWIELWNGSSVTVNLKDWRLRDGLGNTIQIVNSNRFLDPGEFALLSKANAAWNSDCYGALLPDTLNVELGGTITIDTTSGIIKLLDSGLNIVDRVDYGGVGLSPATNLSIERKILGFDTASGNTFNSSDFEVRTPATAGFAIPQNQSVVINEFLIRTTSDNDDWVEIYNKGAATVDVSGWVLKDTSATALHTFPTSTPIPAGGFLAIPDMSNRLGNSGDKIYLFDNLGNLMDGISYFKMPIPANGTSIGRTTDGSSTWSTFTTPTKGVTNTSPTSSWP